VAICSTGVVNGTHLNSFHAFGDFTASLETKGMPIDKRELWVPWCVISLKGQQVLSVENSVLEFSTEFDWSEHFGFNATTDLIFT
jgi:hypothetical protein